MTWIQTNSQKKFHPLDPKTEMVDVRDIFHALSHLCRYNGHANTLYTVAHHSVLVAKMVEALGGTREEIKWGLAHDFAEAYCGDMPSPIKNHPSMAAFREMESKVMAVIAEKIGLVGPEPAIVKDVDRAMIYFEAKSFLVFDGVHPDWPFTDTSDVMKKAMASIGGIESVAHTPPPRMAVWLGLEYENKFLLG